ncbi:MAG TPA: class I SAM-dependent methyltransferase [Solirubrobacteraceae bacterium]|nr:class I SAM-dependent methyltransferase [Solirubrobacteraceae bacterium]
MPRVLALGERLLRIASRLRSRLLGVSELERWWASRPESHADSYFFATDAPYRSVLIDRLVSLHPTATSFLELGCGGGPNLRLLAERKPEAEIEGIELGEAVVSRARILFEASGCRNVRLRAGRAQDLLPLMDPCDVVFSCGALCLISPDEIEGALRAAVQKARLGCVFLEPYADVPQANLPGSDIWNHDLQRLAGATWELTPEPVVWASADPSQVETRLWRIIGRPR